MDCRRRPFLVQLLIFFFEVLFLTSCFTYMVLDTYEVATSSLVWEEAPEAAGLYARLLDITCVLMLAGDVFAACLLFRYVVLDRPLAAVQREEDELQPAPWMPVAATIVVEAYEHDQAGAPALECAVCLGEVEKGQTNSRLPACLHVFHHECVARWLRHHTTCPVAGAAPCSLTRRWCKNG